MRDAVKVCLGSCQQLILSMATHIQLRFLMALDVTTLSVLQNSSLDRIAIYYDDATPR